MPYDISDLVYAVSDPDKDRIIFTHDAERLVEKGVLQSFPSIDGGKYYMMYSTLDDRMNDVYHNFSKEVLECVAKAEEFVKDTKKL